MGIRLPFINIYVCSGCMVKANRRNKEVDITGIRLVGKKG